MKSLELVRNKLLLWIIGKRSVCINCVLSGRPGDALLTIGKHGGFIANNRFVGDCPPIYEIRARVDEDMILQATRSGWAAYPLELQIVEEP